MNALVLRSERPKFLVFRNGKIGNTLVATPFLRGLKQALPNCLVHVVADGLGRELLAGNPFADRVFVFERGADGISAQAALVRRFRQEGYDASLHLRTGTRNELLALAAGVPVRAGFPLRGSPQVLTHVFHRDTSLHVVEQYRSFLSALVGREVAPTLPELFSVPEWAGRAEAWLAGRVLAARPFCLIHPLGKTGGDRPWDFGLYRELTARLSGAGLASVLMGAPSEKAMLVREFPESATVFHLAEEPFRLKIEAVRRAAYFVGADSGPAHLAEAWGVPKTVVYLNDMATYLKWHPLRRDISRTLFESELNAGTAESVIRSAEAALRRAA